jgi:hypothetical protein
MAAHIRRPDKSLLEEIERIASSNKQFNSPDELKSQIATLAQAIVEIATHCQDLENSAADVAQRRDSISQRR